MITLTLPFDRILPKLTSAIPPEAGRGCEEAWCSDCKTYSLWARPIAGDLTILGCDNCDFSQPSGLKNTIASLGLTERDIVRQTAAMPSKPGPLCLADVKREAVDWLWRGWIPLGKVSMLIGDPGLGKSNLSLDIAARLTSGRPMPFQNLALHEPADVLLLLAEDGLADTVRPRLEAGKADLRRVHAYPPDMALELLCNLDQLRVDIQEKQVRLVIVDPLMAFFPAALDSHKDQHARRLLSPVAALAQETGAAFLLIHHPNKSGGGQAIYRAGGSIGIVGAARAATIIAQDPDDATKRIMASVKNNLGKPVPSLRFYLEAATDIESDPDDAPPRVVWEDVAEEHTASTLLSVTATPAEATSEREYVIEFLRDALKDGPVRASEIERAATSEGYSEATLKRARKQLGVKSQRVGGTGDKGYWSWTLPLQHDDAANA